MGGSRDGDGMEQERRCTGCVAMRLAMNGGCLYRVLVVIGGESGLFIPPAYEAAFFCWRKDRFFGHGSEGVGGGGRGGRKRDGVSE